MKPLAFFLLLFIFWSFSPIDALSQPTALDTVVFSAPSKNFQNIKLYSYKGRPLFSSVLDVRGLFPNVGQHQYMLALEKKYLNGYYQKMQTEYPTSGTNFRYSQSYNDTSSIAQAHMMKVLTALISKDGFNKYFCKTNNCLKKAPAMIFSGSQTVTWGGRGVNEFETLESFKSFIDEDFSNFLKWNPQLPETVFILTRESLEEYDFKSKAFPFNFNPSPAVGQSLYCPKFDYEKWMMDENFQSTYFIGLLNMAPDEAKRFTEKSGHYRYVYVLYQIQWNGYYDARKNHLKYLMYHLASPVIEIFESPELKNKLGEIKIVNQK